MRFPVSDVVSACHTYARPSVSDDCLCCTASSLGLVNALTLLCPCAQGREQPCGEDHRARHTRLPAAVLRPAVPAGVNECELFGRLCEKCVECGKRCVDESGDVGGEELTAGLTSCCQWGPVHLRRGPLPLSRSGVANKPASPCTDGVWATLGHCCGHTLPPIVFVFCAGAFRLLFSDCLLYDTAGTVHRRHSAATQDPSCYSLFWLASCNSLLYDTRAALTGGVWAAPGDCHAPACTARRRGRAGAQAAAASQASLPHPPPSRDGQRVPL